MAIARLWLAKARKRRSFWAFVAGIVQNNKVRGSKHKPFFSVRALPCVFGCITAPRGEALHVALFRNSFWCWCCKQANTDLSLSSSFWVSLLMLLRPSRMPTILVTLPSRDSIDLLVSQWQIRFLLNTAVTAAG